MKKLKIYLDTSIISHLDALDTEAKMRETLELWESIKADKYEIVMSDLVFEEISKCYLPKRDKLTDFLRDIDYVLVKNSKEIETIAKKIVQIGILTATNYNDALHIAFAIFNKCDILVSWNFKHMVNDKTEKGIIYLACLLNIQDIQIISPTKLLQIIKEEK